MSSNLNNAFRNVQEARTALRLERDGPNTPEQMMDLVECDGLLSEVEKKVVKMEKEK